MASLTCGLSSQSTQAGAPRGWTAPVSGRQRVGSSNQRQGLILLTPSPRPRRSGKELGGRGRPGRLAGGRGAADWPGTRHGAPGSGPGARPLPRASCPLPLQFALPPPGGARRAPGLRPRGARPDPSRHPTARQPSIEEAAKLWPPVLAPKPCQSRPSPWETERREE